MKILKQEKGSITLFVLIAMLFFAMYLVGMYLLNSNAETTGLAETKRIKEIYEQGINNIDDVYATLENNNKEWSNTYAKTKVYTDIEGNTAWIPEGFQVCLREGENKVTDGLVIRNAEDLNEFVWIPVDGNNIKYERATWTINSITQDITSTFTEEVSNDEQTSILVYGGYYIGRYETGIIEYDTNAETSNSNNITTWTGYTGGKLVIQQGKQTWNYITRDRAKTEASALYNKVNNNVTSKLCSSYAWDTALKFIETKNSTYSISSAQGNYVNTTFYYEDLDGNIQQKVANSKKLVPTGQTTAVNNIYDMGGNVYEWTTEKCNSTNTPYVMRGGGYDVGASETPAGRRNIFNNTFASVNVGFRVALFL